LLHSFPLVSQRWYRERTEREGRELPERLGRGERKRRVMKTLTIHAIYEDGKLRPLTPLPLQDQERVLLKVMRHSAVQETQGLLQGLAPEVVQEVAEGDEFSVLS